MSYTSSHPEEMFFQMSKQFFPFERGTPSPRVSATTEIAPKEKELK